MAPLLAQVRTQICTARPHPPGPAAPGPSQTSRAPFTWFLYLPVVMHDTQTEARWVREAVQVESHHHQLLPDCTSPALNRCRRDGSDAPAGSPAPSLGGPSKCCTCGAHREAATPGNQDPQPAHSCNKPRPSACRSHLPASKATLKTGSNRGTVPSYLSAT